jgi:hypothetical protein
LVPSCVKDTEREGSRGEWGKGLRRRKNYCDRGKSGREEEEGQATKVLLLELCSVKKKKVLWLSQEKKPDGVTGSERNVGTWTGGCHNITTQFPYRNGSTWPGRPAVDPRDIEEAESVVTASGVDPRFCFFTKTSEWTSCL